MSELQVPQVLGAEKALVASFPTLPARRRAELDATLPPNEMCYDARLARILEALRRRSRAHALTGSGPLAVTIYRIGGEEIPFDEAFGCTDVIEISTGIPRIEADLRGVGVRRGDVAEYVAELERLMVHDACGSTADLWRCVDELLTARRARELLRLAANSHNRLGAGEAPDLIAAEMLRALEDLDRGGRAA